MPLEQLGTKCPAQGHLSGNDDEEPSTALSLPHQDLPYDGWMDGSKYHGSWLRDRLSDHESPVSLTLTVLKC